MMQFKKTRLVIRSHPWTEGTARSADPRHLGLSERVNELHAGRLEMAFIMRGEGVAVEKRRGCDERILASHRAVLGLQLGEQLFPRHQHRLGQWLRGRREPSPRLVQPDG